MLRQPTVGDLIIRALRRYPERLAFTGADGEASYSDVALRVARLIALFDTLGLEKGATVAQLARNSISQWSVIAACYIAGLRSVTMQAYAADPEGQAYFLRKSDADVVICDAEFAGCVQPLTALVPRVRNWFCHQEAIPGAVGLAEAMEKVAPTELVDRAEPEDIVRVGFTSGTTGPAKGVLLSSRALAACAVINTSEDPWPRRPVVLCAEGVAGGFGNFIVPTLMLGGTVVLGQRAEPEVVLALMGQYRPNMLLCLPMLFNAILDHSEAGAVDWSSLELLIFSGASIAPTRLAEAQGLFGPVVSQVYGQTDCPKGLAILTRADHSRPDKLGSVGTPFSTVEVAILGRDGGRCAVGEIGELCARGPIVMSGYAQEPELSAARLSNGWLHTGDLASQDVDGYLTLYDRVEYRLVDGERTVPARQVEDGLRGRAGILDVALVQHGGRVTAFVVGADGISDEAVRDHARRAGWDRIDAVRIIDELPLLMIGRVNKGLLRQWAEAA
ncbi:AMP-binding protein [Mesorhizobium sp. DCY119]|uniref:AMP-binding protein n=1 Tax=Mesorhizobium sp. DCY119 TaxID=2108445 RepID=UPI001403C4C4|nr:AMP-binding protein [Mesorhizobium sp. DCY119]